MNNKISFLYLILIALILLSILDSTRTISPTNFYYDSGSISVSANTSYLIVVHTDSCVDADYQAYNLVVNEYIGTTLYKITYNQTQIHTGASVDHMQFTVRSSEHLVVYYAKAIYSQSNFNATTPGNTISSGNVNTVPTCNQNSSPIFKATGFDWSTGIIPIIGLLLKKKKNSIHHR